MPLTGEPAPPPDRPAPRSPPSAREARDEAGRIVELAGQGLSPIAIAQAVYGYKNARAVGKVRAVLGD